MRRIIDKILGKLGSRSPVGEMKRPFIGTMENSLHSLAQKHTINTIIDVGASDGIWSQLAMKFFPRAQYLLIEANSAHEAKLKDFVQRNSNAEFILAAAGDRQGGQVNFSFDPQDLYGGQASYAPGTASIPVSEVMIDNEVNSRQLEGPYLLKLDTHGFEIPILKGASETLKSADVLIIECYNFEISAECLLFHEMCAHLDKLGFRCIDMADPLWRPYDQAFWQMDLVFIRKDRLEFSYSNYS